MRLCLSNVYTWQMKASHPHRAMSKLPCNSSPSATSLTQPPVITGIISDNPYMIRVLRSSQPCVHSKIRQHWPGRYGYIRPRAREAMRILHFNNTRTLHFFLGGAAAPRPLLSHLVVLAAGMMHLICRESTLSIRFADLPTTDQHLPASPCRLPVRLAWRCSVAP